MDLADSPDQGQLSKRKSEDGAGQPRAKRNRYISIACNECKRRKIKCNGNSPCQRCGNLSLDCVYAPNCCGVNFKDTDDWKQVSAQILSLQEQVDALFANVSSLRSELSQANPPLDPSLQSTSFLGGQTPTLGLEHDRVHAPSAPRVPTFRGPMSNAFSFDVAKSSLHTMGIASDGPGNDEDGGGTANGSPVGSPRLQHGRLDPLKSHKDPIWSISRGEALRLLEIYEEETHEMYPVISMDHVRRYVMQLYKFLDVMRDDVLRPNKPGPDTIDGHETNLLKLMLAIALIVEGKGRSEMGQRLFQSVQPSVDRLLLAPGGVGEIRLLALVAIYEFHSDNESTAWRVIGLTARSSIELGLHRRETYDKIPDEDRDLTILLFWSIYTLDRRWSFGTGMPFALQDSDIDSQLPRPGDKSLYLTAMIDYYAIGSQVWKTFAEEDNGSSSQAPTVVDIPYMDYKVRQWHRNLPPQLRFDHHTLDSLGEHRASKGSVNVRHKIVLYLRQNSMLINIYRPILYSATNIIRNPQQASEVVNVAKDTIHTLTRINQMSEMYQTSQVLFNAFLTSALAVLFLAVSHAPAEFSRQVREEFYLALELVRGFSKGSFVSKRLWKTIRVLMSVGPKLGLTSSDPPAPVAPVHYRTPSNPPDAEDPNRSAALAMAGLAGHNVDGFGYGIAKGWPQTPGGGGHFASPENMANDLTKLFEAAGAFEGQNGFAGVLGDNGGGGGAATEGGFAGEDELSKIMRDLF
ncbi:fungal-specific transcription factor-like protein [Myriangium duriaei CBS 260.36]|uniref:Fungal-specific transcription factor-like protein n=1 Tax=Myriangium duriaei CBS 260.36 TaxID=1168546 RepID=A0A9P4MIW6_9PEZI|nr:fungal-specific transcription factor-like protein [Myriangium duriaei CBS 260.36]